MKHSLASRLFGLGLSLCVTSAVVAQPGTTIITHGFQLASEEVPGWGYTMATAIANRYFDATAGVPTILEYQPNTGEWAYVAGSFDRNEEIILLLNWAAESDYDPFGQTNRKGTALAAADAFYAALRDPQLPGPLDGHSLLDAPGGGGQRRLHFIGHSRGSVVNSQIVRRLVLAGYTVDHVATLDPHPVDGTSTCGDIEEPDLLDPDPLLWDGVIWADNYWRAGGCFDKPLCDPDGQQIEGTFDTELNILKGGDPIPEHSKVHAWYHGTIDLKAKSDGDIDQGLCYDGPLEIDRDEWYGPDGGATEGYYYSQIGGGAEARIDHPEGLAPEAGGTAVRLMPIVAPSVINSDFEFGASEVAGWYYHGGSINSDWIVEEGRATFLKLGAGYGLSATHNRFYLDANSETITFMYRVFESSADDYLVFVLTDTHDGLQYYSEFIELSSTTDSFQQETVDVNPAAPLDRAYTLTVAVVDENNQSVQAVVGIDEIVITELQPGTVLSHQKISDTEGGFTGTLDNSDFFGLSAAGLGDLDGDGVGDLAVGAVFDDDGGTDRGAVWMLFLNPDGTVNSHRKISSTQGGFTGTLDNGDVFGASLASLGDLDGDSVGDLAVGTTGDDDGGGNRGAVWILFLNPDGTVKAHQKISDTQGGFTGTLDNLDLFGGTLASLGDLDGDGVGDLAVGAPQDDDGGTNRGAVWILFLNTNGTVKSDQKISDTQGGFTGSLGNEDVFGGSLASLGDLDGDSVSDLAVGAYGDDDGGGSQGAVWILFLNPDGTVKSHQKISDTQGGFTGELDNNDLFGRSVASLGDLDGDSVGDLAVGASKDDDGGTNRGAVWVLFLNSDGTVKSHQKISDTEGGFTGPLDDNDQFGRPVAALGDLDGDGKGDLVAGTAEDDDGGTNRGAVWVLFLDGVPDSGDPDIPGDLDGDGSVGASDLLILLVNWGPCGDCNDCLADLDDDCNVGASDLLILLVNWG